MEEKILEFVQALRKFNIRITPSEEIDCLHSLSHIPLEEKEIFRMTLQTTLIKRAADIPTFQNLFDLHFNFEDKKNRPSEKNSLMALYNPLEENLLDYNTLAEKIDLALEEASSNITALSRHILGGNGGQLHRWIKAKGQEVGIQNMSYFLQVNDYTQKIIESFDWKAIETDLNLLLNILAQKGLDGRNLNQTKKLLHYRVNLLKNTIRQYVRQEFEKKDFTFRQKLAEEALMDKNLLQYTEREVETMKGMVVQLAQRLKELQAIRQKKARRNRLNVKGIFRKNLKYGGIPLDLSFKEKKKRKPQVVTLCDVSNSVRNASRFMLQFLYSLQDQFSRVRSFIFVDEIAEVTDLFKTYPLEEAITRAMTQMGIAYHHLSDFGSAFSAFCDNYLSAVTNKTTVIIMGDARNNQYHPREGALKEIKAQAKRIIWLNPESSWSWNFGDSIMSHYEPYCDSVVECRNIKQLAEVIDTLVL
jgi:uncharacterized protein with von Willebrand factor type A (vWA) domain